MGRKMLHHQHRKKNLLLRLNAIHSSYSDGNIFLFVLLSILLVISNILPVYSSNFGLGSIGSLFSSNRQQQGNQIGNQMSANLVGSPINAMGPSGMLNMGSTGSLMGTRLMNLQSGRQQQQQQSGNIFSGLIPGLDGLFGLGGGGDSGGGGAPFLPPGMTMTPDGCLCPIPKGRTKYIAVEVPKIIYVPPKEKTKVITIKEIREVPVTKYKEEHEGGYEEDHGVSFDTEKCEGDHCGNSYGKS